MFRGPKVEFTRIALMDMHLIDIPPMNSLLFVKAKQSRRGIHSSKYPVEKTTVIFSEPLLFDFNLPRDPGAHRCRPLRLSFRRETSSRSGFARYGVCEVNVLEMILTGQSEIRYLLSDCMYNTYFIGRLALPEGSPYPEPELSPCPSLYRDRQSSSGSETPSDRAFSRGSQGSSSDSSSRSRPSLFDSLPVKVSLERFLQLEEQVDGLLAGIVIDRAT
jgi:hypothetical protein